MWRPVFTKTGVRKKYSQFLRRDENIETSCYLTMRWGEGNTKVGQARRFIRITRVKHILRGNALK